MLVPCTSKDEFVRCFIRECRPEMQQEKKKHHRKPVISRKVSGKERPSKYDEQKIRKWYIEDGLTMREIAERYGVKEKSIGNFLHRKKINRL